MSNEISKEQISRFIKNINHEFVYHYTSIDAFYNILKNKELWIGNSSTMNDKEELVGFVKSIKDNLLQDISIKDNDKFESFFSNLDHRLEIESPYILCFSSLKEDAAQWERYANNATGVCLEIKVEELAKICIKNFFLSTNVYYDYDVTKHEYFEILKNYFNSGIIKGFNDEKGLIDNIILGATAYKNQSFKSESEYRISNIWGINPAHSKEDYKLKNGMIRKMLIIEIDKLLVDANVSPDILINEIIVGPRSNQPIKDIKDFISNCGLPNLAQKIHKSKCSLR